MSDCGHNKDKVYNGKDRVAAGHEYRQGMIDKVSVKSSDMQTFPSPRNKDEANRNCMVRSKDLRTNNQKIMNAQ